MLSRVLKVLCFALVVFLWSQTVQAKSAKEALDQGLNEVMNLIKSEAYANQSTRADVQGKIAVVVKRYFDFGEFSSRTVGERWRTFSEQQHRDFSEAFADLLITTYVSKIDGYNGEQINYVGEKTSAKGDRTEVMTIVNLKNGKKIPVNYRMLPKDNTWKVYDVLIENISLVKNYRTQFQDILQTSTPEQLITRIQAKTAEAKQQHVQK